MLDVVNGVASTGAFSAAIWVAARIARLEEKSCAHRETMDKFTAQDEDMHASIDKSFHAVETRLQGVESALAKLGGQMEVWADWWRQGKGHR